MASKYYAYVWPSTNLIGLRHVKYASNSHATNTASMAVRTVMLLISCMLACF